MCRASLLSKRGEARGDAFPADAAFRINPDAKRDTLLVDNIANVEAVLLCSDRLRRFIEGRQPTAIEYLSVTVQDHKKKPVPAAQFIVLPLDPPGCIDFTASVVTRSTMDPTALRLIDKLVLDESKIPADRLIFKPEGYTALTLEVHEAPSVTLVIVNTVKRAVEVAEALSNPVKRARGAAATESPEVCLVHSRFRGAERQHEAARLHRLLG